MFKEDILTIMDMYNYTYDEAVFDLVKSKSDMLFFNKELLKLITKKLDF